MKKKVALLISTALCLVLFQGISVAVSSVNEVFADVRDPGAYYYTPVYWAYENEITTGTSATTFSPNLTCTRGQFVTFLWRAAGKPNHTGQNPFSDVKAGDYYYDSVLWAYENEITTGTSAKAFSPNLTCTRGQCVTFLWRAQGKPGHSIRNPFTDVKETDYFYDAVLWAYEKEVTTGTSATAFSPSKNCSRAQTVTFLHRFSQLDDSIINPDNLVGKYMYFRNNSEILAVIDAEESPDLLSEGEAITLLRGRGFDDDAVKYEYSITGEYFDDAEAAAGSTVIRPMFYTYYVSSSGDAWTVFVINGEVFANPASYNLLANTGAQLLLSESGHLTSYDNDSNRYFVTVPYASAVVVKTVEKIDAATLDRLSFEEINRL